MMVDLTIWSNWPTAGHIGVLFPILIGISALKTKQHFLWDVPAGAITGVAVFVLWHALVW
jgi:membrane-associated phospholipid phosphatase